MFLRVNKIEHDSIIEPRVVHVLYIHHIRPAHSTKWGDHCGIYFADTKTWWNVVEDYETIASKLMCE